MLYNTAMQTEALTFLDSWLGYRSRQVDIPGFAVAIYQEDSIIFAKAYGQADIERQHALHADHLFGMASQSKMFTATAIMQLAEQGKLRLDDYACAYIPWLVEHRDRRVRHITIRQLLSHQAGLIRDGLETDFWELQQAFPDQPALRRMVLAADLALEPNAQLKYSNLGFALLGQIVEAASGQSHTDSITKRIITPLKLDNTFAEYTPALDKRLATAYGVPFEHQRPVLMPRLAANTFAAAVGIHATTINMCEFAAAHFLGNNVLLSDRSKRMMQRTQSGVKHGYDRGMEFGLGFEVQTIGKRRVIGHGGHVAGYLTATFFDPKAKLAVSVAANSKDAPSVQIVRGIFEALDWFAAHADKPAPRRLARYNTRLHNATTAVEIIAARGQIVAIDPDDWEPFTWAETLERISANTLHVTTPGSVFNQGELIRYAFAGDNIKSVRYAGATLLPETTYRRSFTEPRHKK